MRVVSKVKVLITGGYGFIGSHVADRFHKEGAEVYILDNLSTGRKEHVSFKHKSYILPVEDEKCEEIFRSNRFDAVVHLAAQISVASSESDPLTDSQSNVLGMLNMLHLSRKYKVGKLIYASSAAAYGTQTELPIKETAECSPISPYGISKLAGETYGQKWNELYGLQTLGFRFSNVYGPRQDAVGEGGVIAVFVDRMLNGQTLVVHGDGSQTRDFIYVEDIADAIYRATSSSITGIYNLSTGTEQSINDVVAILKGDGGTVNVVYGDKRPGDIDRSVLDNTRVKRDLDWSPLYTLEEGLKRTYAYFQAQQPKREAAAAAAPAAGGLNPFGKALKRLLPYGENLLAFALTAWLTLSQEHTAYGVIDAKLFYITIMGILYGNRQSILAVVMSIGLFVYQKLQDGREFISLLYDTDFFFQIAIYLFIGLVVGYAIERKNAQIHNQEQKIVEMEGKYEFLNGVYQEVREVKEELQLRILNSGDSYGKIYSITKELESLEPEKVFTATVNVVQTVMNAPAVTIYTVNRNRTYLRMLAYSGNGQIKPPKSLKAEEHDYLLSVIRDGAMYVNKRLDEGTPLMCAPLYHGREVAAVVMIDGLSFENFSSYHQNLFKITVDLAASALDKAFAYIQAAEGQRYLEGTPLLLPEAFRSILESKKEAFRKYNTPYLLLEGPEEDKAADIVHPLAGMLRETDYCGLNERRRLCVLLSNTSAEDAAPVLERLKRLDVSFAMVEEERRHVGN